MREHGFAILFSDPGADRTQKDADVEPEGLHHAAGLVMFGRSGAGALLSFFVICTVGIRYFYIKLKLRISEYHETRGLCCSRHLYISSGIVPNCHLPTNFGHIGFTLKHADITPRTLVALPFTAHGADSTAEHLLQLVVVQNVVIIIFPCFSECRYGKCAQ